MTWRSQLLMLFAIQTIATVGATTGLVSFIVNTRLP